MFLSFELLNSSIKRLIEIITLHVIIFLNSLLHDFKRTKYNLELKKSFIILPTIALYRQG